MSASPNTFRVFIATSTTSTPVILPLRFLQPTFLFTQLTAQNAKDTHRTASTVAHSMDKFPVLLWGTSMLPFESMHGSTCKHKVTNCCVAPQHRDSPVEFLPSVSQDSQCCCFLNWPGETRHRWSPWTSRWCSGWCVWGAVVLEGNLSADGKYGVWVGRYVAPGPPLLWGFVAAEPAQSICTATG